MGLIILASLKLYCYNKNSTPEGVLFFVSLVDRVQKSYITVAIFILFINMGLGKIVLKWIGDENEDICKL